MLKVMVGNNCGPRGTYRFKRIAHSLLLAIYIHSQLNTHSHLMLKCKKNSIYTPNDLHQSQGTCACSFILSYLNVACGSYIFLSLVLIVCYFINFLNFNTICCWLNVTLVPFSLMQVLCYYKNWCRNVGIAYLWHVRSLQFIIKTAKVFWI